MHYKFFLVIFVTVLVFKTKEMIKRIISGGQSGVDQAALKASTLMKVPTGGWAPYNWMTEDGPREGLLKQYNLVADRYDTSTYQIRTESNIDAADGTLIITWGLKSPGTSLTKSLCVKNRAHYFVLENIKDPVALYETIEWIKNHKIKILNVAGPRESKIGKIPTESTVNFIMKIIKFLNSK